MSKLSLEGSVRSFDVVVDAGHLAAHGLIMELATCRWDVLGRVEEVLNATAAMFGLLRSGGRLLAALTGDPLEYLVSYLSQFAASLRELPRDCAAGPRVYEAVCELPDTATRLQEVLRREVLEERSHRRYADVLDKRLAGTRLSVLDVGGGDGHMAEWWMASGHTISLLEVSEEEARAAAARLGADRVTLHDGASAWPYASKSFDVCLFLHVLHHIMPEVSVKLALSEAARVSRRGVLVLEDQPRGAASAGMCRLAAAVTAEHFRPFGQDPGVYMRNIRPHEAWRSLFEGAGLRVAEASLLPGTLQHPVPHVLYDLRPMDGG